MCCFNKECSSCPARGAGLKFFSVLTTLFLPKNRIYKVKSCQAGSLVFLCPQASKISLALPQSTCQGPYQQDFGL